MTRPSRGLGVCLVLVLLVAAPSAGHGGDEVAAGRNAAYSLSVQASERRDNDGQRAVDLTAYPVRRANGAPETDAVVTVGIDGRAPLRAAYRGDGYELLIPADRPRAWREWRISATVRGAAGALTVTSEPRGRPSSASPSWLTPAGLVGLLAAGGLVILVRRRRGTLAAADRP